MFISNMDIKKRKKTVWNDLICEMKREDIFFFSLKLTKQS